MNTLWKRHGSPPRQGTAAALSARRPIQTPGAALCAHYSRARPQPLTDFYQAMLSAPWWQFLSVLAILYFLIDAVFALLYMLDPCGIEGARPYSFRDALFFSMQTLGTYSTNVMAPKDFYTDTIVTLESFFSVLNIAIATGAVFARVARPTARVMFSRCVWSRPSKVCRR
jgi:hypothetical protein